MINNFNGSALKSIRKSNNLTQLQLSKLLGVKQHQISAWENSYHTPTISHITKLCSILNCDINSLIIN